MVIKKKTKKVSAPRKKLFHATLQIANDIYKLKGDDLSVLFRTFKPTSIKARGVLTVKYGKNTFSKIMVIPQVKQLLNNDLTAQVIAKNFLIQLQH